MTKVEELKKKAELAALNAALAQHDFKIEEFKENIERIEMHRAVQLEAIKKLEDELNNK
jgi:uncharacterized coiled-coil protein SlyX